MTQQDVFNRAIWVDAGESSAKFHILRGKFRVGKVKRAMLRAMGLGFFHCYINGVRVGDELFLPLNTDFEPRDNFPTGEIVTGHRVHVPEFDVTDLLREGENVIAIHFGGGWYTYDQEVKFGDAKAIWRIFGEDDGGAFDFGSSDQDRIGDSFVVDYWLTRTEVHDYRLSGVCGTEDGFDDAAWSFAAPAKPLQNTEYGFSDCPADRVSELLPVKTVGLSDGWTVYDCGKNTSGWPVLKLSAKAGEEIEVLFSEELNPDGTLNERFAHEQSMKIIADGSEREVRPLFTWFAFRYFAVKGAAQPAGVEVVHMAVKVTSSFHSDNELLNWIHDTYLNTQLTNLHSGIPSDCPHIERRGYTGDGQLTCHAVMNMLDAKAFYGKWIKDIGDCQDVLTGHVQYTAPYTRCGGGPGGWGCAIVEVPYEYYRQYGDVSVLEKYYPQMLRYFDYLESKSYAKLVISDKEGEWCLGDWCPPISVVLPAPFVNNYFYIKCLNRCVEIVKLIGREEDLPMLEARIAERKEAVMAAYYNKWDGNFLGNLQGANAFAVDMGLGDERTYRNLVKYYKSLKSYDTGIFGTDIVTRVLFEHGDGQLAVDLLLATHPTSFAGMRDLGATTLWEYWPRSLEDRSHNHPMFGAVIAYFYDYLLGIRAKNGSAAYRELVIAPVLVEGVNRISGSRMIPSGEVSVFYEKSASGTVFTVCIPDGQTAEFVLGDEVRSLHAGENRFVM